MTVIFQDTEYLDNANTTEEKKNKVFPSKEIISQVNAYLANAFEEIITKYIKNKNIYREDFKQFEAEANLLIKIAKHFNP